MSRYVGRISAALCLFGFCHVVAPAQQVTVDLGQSGQSFTLTGTGGNKSFGTYNITQGACSSGGGGLTSCNLTGAFTGSTPGYTSGTYDFLTTYASSTSFFPVQGQSVGAQGTANFDKFSYSYFDPSVNMTLNLVETGGGNYSLPLVTNGNLASNLTALSFAFVSATCGGTSLGSLPCGQGDVGLVNGAFYTGPVTGVAGVNIPVVTPPPTATPEPASLSLLGLATLACLVRRRKVNSTH